MSLFFFLIAMGISAPIADEILPRIVSHYEKRHYTRSRRVAVSHHRR